MTDLQSSGLIKELASIATHYLATALPNPPETAKTWFSLRWASLTEGSHSASGSAAWGWKVSVWPGPVCLAHMNRDLAADWFGLRPGCAFSDTVCLSVCLSGKGARFWEDATSALWADGHFRSAPQHFVLMQRCQTERLQNGRKTMLIRSCSSTLFLSVHSRNRNRQKKETA